MNQQLELPLAAKAIPLTRGKVAIVDASDFEILSAWKWFALKGGNTNWYAGRKQSLPNGKQTLILMHRVLVDVSQGTDVDHINTNGLDNRRANLRPATGQQNMCNRGLQGNNTSGFKGVSRMRGKWRARVQVDRKTIYLGVFDTPEEAALAYDTAAANHHGAFARLNSQEGD